MECVITCSIEKIFGFLAIFKSKAFLVSRAMALSKAWFIFSSFENFELIFFGCSFSIECSKILCLLFRITIMQFYFPSVTFATSFTSSNAKFLIASRTNSASTKCLLLLFVIVVALSYSYILFFCTTIITFSTHVTS